MSIEGAHQGKPRKTTIAEWDELRASPDRQYKQSSFFIWICWNIGAQSNSSLELQTYTVLYLSNKIAKVYFLKKKEKKNTKIGSKRRMKIYLMKDQDSEESWRKPHWWRPIKMLEVNTKIQRRDASIDVIKDSLVVVHGGVIIIGIVDEIASQSRKILWRQ